MTRAPRLGRRRRKTHDAKAGESGEQSLDRTASIGEPATAIAGESKIRRELVALEGAGKRASPRRNRPAAKSRESELAAIAAEIQSPSDSERSLAEVATKLAAPSRRPHGRSLAEVAAAIASPTVPAREIGGPLDFVLPSRPISIEVIGGRGHYERVIGAIREAHTSVWIATANAKELMIEDDRARWRARTSGARPGRRRSHRGSAYVSILVVLDELAARGVELRLLHAELPSGPFRDELAQHPRLVAGGLALRRCPRVHLKAVVIDGSLLYLGSANWTGAGLGAKGSGRRNFELGFVTDDTQLLDHVQALYERIWSGGECEACKLRDDCPGPLADLDRPTQLVQLSEPRRRERLPATSRIGRRRRPRLI